VKTAIPKFESESTIEMSDILRSMGMQDAFDADQADFTGLGQSERGNIYISRVLHKTYIAVDEKGTRAGAATVVEMAGAGMPLEEPKTVYLDRPFVYMLIDRKSVV
jgi:serpin B